MTELSPLTAGAAALDLIEFAKSDVPRFQTGWTLDDRVGCVGVGEMVLMWARTSAGKSTWMLNLIAGSPEVPTLVVNMEMTPRRQIEWLAAMSFRLQVPARQLDNVIRDPAHRDYKSVLQAFEEIQYTFPNLHFVMPSRPEVGDIRVMLDDIAADTGVKPQRVFIDHLGLMGSCTDYAGYSMTTGKLHHLALEEQVAMFVVQQTGRGGGTDGSRNDGHRPVSLTDGVFAGEADADWVFGMYRPEKDPKFKKQRRAFKTEEDYWDMRAELDEVRDLSVLQVLKNRIFSDVLEEGIELRYDHMTRRLTEV